MACSSLWFVVGLCLFVTVASSDVKSFNRPKNNDCVLDVTASSVELFPEQFQVSSADDLVQVQTARGFTVEYVRNYKVVENLMSNETYVLYQCGTSPPSPGSFPPGSKFFQIPLTSVASYDTTPFAFMNLLEVDDRVYSVPSFVTDPCGQLLVTCNRTTSVFLDTSNSTAVEVTFGPFMDAMFVTPYVAPSPSPLVINVNSVSDPGPLHRAEWIKFVATFFNQEAKANEIFNATVDEYMSLKALASQVSERPTMAWITHYTYLEEENYQISFDQYKLTFVEDGGGSSLVFEDVAELPGVSPGAFEPEDLVFGWATNTSFGSKEEAKAAFLDVLKEVDIVIDETYTPDPASYTLDTFKSEYGITPAEESDLPFLQSGRVFRVDGLLSESNGLDWFENAVVKPHQVLRDVVRATNPQLLENPDTYVWLRNIAANESVVVAGPEACLELNAGCDITPEVICPFVAVCKDGSTVQLMDQGVGCKYETCSA